jgi:hypothetical protein
MRITARSFGQLDTHSPLVIPNTGFLAAIFPRTHRPESATPVDSLENHAFGRFSAAHGTAMAARRVPRFETATLTLTAHGGSSVTLWDEITPPERSPEPARMPPLPEPAQPGPEDASSSFEG